MAYKLNYNTQRQKYFTTKKGYSANVFYEDLKKHKGKKAQLTVHETHCTKHCSYIMAGWGKDLYQDFFFN